MCGSGDEALRLFDGHIARGERFVIESVPKYLAVGAPDVRLTVRDREVDITPWIVNGQLRIGSRDFASPQLTGN